MTLLDRGPETVRVFPSVESSTGDNYGRPRRLPGEEYVDVKGVFMIPATLTTRTDPKYSEDPGQGEAVSRRFTVIGPDRSDSPDLGALDAWAEVEWPIGSGQRFDVNGPPVHHTFPAKLAHYQAQLVER